VDGAGVQVPSDRPQDVAAGVRRALELGPEACAEARERALTAFPLDVRRQGLWGAVEALWSAHSS
jgi:hypothetical protein